MRFETFYFEQIPVLQTSKLFQKKGRWWHQSSFSSKFFWKQRIYRHLLVMNGFISRIALYNKKLFEEKDFDTWWKSTNVNLYKCKSGGRDWGEGPGWKYYRLEAKYCFWSHGIRSKDPSLFYLINFNKLNQWIWFKLHF